MLNYNALENFLPREMRGRATEFFSYAGEILPLAQGATVTQNITVQNDADFVILAGIAQISDPANPSSGTLGIFPPITVQVRDSASGNQYMSQPVPLGAVFASTNMRGALGDVGGHWAYPRIVKAGGSISTTFVNLDAAQDIDVRYTYQGVKVYYIAANV